MKAASADLIALLASKNQYVMRETYTFTLNDGTVLTYTYGDDINGVQNPERDPFFINVVSLLNFRTQFTLPAYPGGFPSQVSVALDPFADPKGTIWTVYGNEHVQPTNLIVPVPDMPANYPIGDGQLLLMTGNSFGCCTLYSAPNAKFAASGDFTIEFTHDENGNDYTTTDPLILLGGFNSSSSQPGAVGEWYLYSRTAAFSYLTFGQCVGTGPFVDVVCGGSGTGGNLFPLPKGPGVKREICIERVNGVLSMAINGQIYARQYLVNYPPNNTPLFAGGISFGGQGTGTYYLPNNYGTGKYSRWRFTVGVARYGGQPYTPTGKPFPAA